MVKNKKIVLLLIFFMFFISSVGYGKGFKSDVYDKTLIKYYYDDSNFYKGGAYPIDDNNDGMYEYYYFNSLGHLYVNTKTPLGLLSNEKGQILIDGIILRVTVDQILDLEKNIDTLKELNKSKAKYSYKDSYTVEKVLKESKEDFYEYVSYFYSFLDNRSVEYYKSDREIKSQVYMYIDKLDIIYNKYIKEIKDLKKIRDISEDSFNYLKESIDKDYKNSIAKMKKIAKEFLGE